MNIRPPLFLMVKIFFDCPLKKLIKCAQTKKKSNTKMSKNVNFWQKKIHKKPLVGNCSI